MSTPLKIKQETTEVSDARVKLGDVLQNLVDRADESLPLDDDIVVKNEHDLDKSFDDIGELESTPTKKSPSKSRKRRKRDIASVEVDQLDDGLRAQNSIVMKLFDRSVDLAQFRPNTALYPVCRAWMANSPSTKIPRRDEPSSPDVLHNIDSSENVIICKLPSPCKTIDEMKEELSRDPRIPSPLPQSDDPLNMDADQDPSQTPSKETLLSNHLQRWKIIRKKWKEASQLNQSRYSESYAILKAMYERQ